MQFLFVIKVKPGIGADVIPPIARLEAAKVWEMHLAGVLRSIHLTPSPGAVLLIEADNQESAEAHVAQLPVVKAGAVDIEVLPLSPYPGFAKLFDPAAA